MGIFGRGNWAVFGVEPDSLQAFQDSLKDDIRRFKASQLAAGVAIKMHGNTTVGINPFGSPRLDEQEDSERPIDRLFVMDLIKALNEDESTPAIFTAIYDFLPTEETLSIGNKAYAFWMVLNDPKDVTDPASKKEALSYKHMGRPFKFLAKKEKEAVEEQVNSSAVMARKQVPVIVDFQHARVYAETTSKVDILVLRELLEGLGAKTFSLFWSFGEASLAVQVPERHQQGHPVCLGDAVPCRGASQAPPGPSGQAGGQGDGEGCLLVLCLHPAGQQLRGLPSGAPPWCASTRCPTPWGYRVLPWRSRCSA